MKNIKSLFVLGVLILSVFSMGALADVEEDDDGNDYEPNDGFTMDFAMDECRFSPNVGNLYFPLNQGFTRTLVGEEDGEEVKVQLTVLKSTENFEVEDVGRIKARVVEEREWIDGEIVEISRNFFATCIQTGDVYYFGEDVDIYEDGEIVSHDGAWRAGVDGAEPGVIMPGSFMLGSRYYQEIAPGIALDRAEHLEMDIDFESKAGFFEDCVTTVETTPLEPGHTSDKTYCPGLGLVVDGVAELHSYSLKGKGK